MRESIKAGLPTVREQFAFTNARVTNVEPLSRRELEKIYRRLDELERRSPDPARIQSEWGVRISRTIRSMNP